MSAPPSSLPPLRLRRLSATAFRRALAAGVARVLAQRELLDRINVFPVPDGDTGANLAHTLRAVLGAARDERRRHLGLLLGRIADRALDGARGNSGVILAQFLQGFSAAAASRPALDLPALAAAAAAGERAAHAAVAEPREGTMLSVMRAFAGELAEQARGGVEDLAAALAAALARARRALAETPVWLAELRAAGVVDAGAKGFVELIAGMLETLGRRGPPPAALPEPDPTGPSPRAEAPCASSYRYCCECLLLGEGAEREAVRARLAGFPCDSLVIAGVPGRLRLHAHADDPAALFSHLEALARVSAPKADDMRAQRAPAGGVALLADSGADLPEGLPGSASIHVVPVRVAFGEEEHLDKLSLASADFYRRLRAGGAPPRTSQPPPGDFQRAFEQLLSHHRAVVGVHISARLSGTLQSARAAAERCDPARIRLVDSRNASAGQGLLVAYAAEAIADGLGAEEVARLTAAMVPRTRSYAVLADLRHAERGGRLPPLARRLAELLGLTPVLRDRDGRLAVAGALLGRGRLPERFAAWVARRLPAGRRLRVLLAHADAPEAAERLEAALLAAVPGLEALGRIPLGGAIAAHAGPDALLVAVQDYEPPASLLARLGGGR
ncbi:MAG: DegV family protein [Xanthomonadales bacterium]|nr:DegV family protein [Xanthomonadales bacterium]